ncbi:hypothetical protein CYMTET_16715 [Cymbomonas tetramitiformis]|uniref:Uncharacterized protein n=1 Tax=Cymbomonas tetramitiformis TaxID=36881 RepID=A0AAE0GBE9_9CHLO|nr:hypothetical protein CYMTET_16715 [Cymbomonas tetramitiformis]
MSDSGGAARVGGRLRYVHIGDLGKEGLRWRYGCEQALCWPSWKDVVRSFPCHQLPPEAEEAAAMGTQITSFVERGRNGMAVIHKCMTAAVRRPRPGPGGDIGGAAAAPQLAGRRGLPQAAAEAAARDSPPIRRAEPGAGSAGPKGHQEGHTGIDRPAQAVRAQAGCFLGGEAAARPAADAVVYCPLERSERGSTREQAERPGGRVDFELWMPLPMKLEELHSWEKDTEAEDEDEDENEDEEELEQLRILAEAWESHASDIPLRPPPPPVPTWGGSTQSTQGDSMEAMFDFASVL